MRSRTNLPGVDRGDALFHVAEIAEDGPGAALDQIEGALGRDPTFDEDVILQARKTPAGTKPAGASAHARPDRQ